MGYFSNGSEGDAYQNTYCDRCVHWENDNPCAVWGLHLLRNYKDCTDKDSALHMLIPRSADRLSNDKCLMFWPSAPASVPKEASSE